MIFLEKTWIIIEFYLIFSIKIQDIFEFLLKILEKKEKNRKKLFFISIKKLMIKKRNNGIYNVFYYVFLYFFSIKTYSFHFWCLKKEKNMTKLEKT